MEAPPIRYAKTVDGARIAYWVMRNGPSAVVQLPRAISHLSREWKLPEIASWYQRLGEGRTLVAYDQRNIGLSRGPGTAWPDHRIDDLEAMLDAAGVQRAALIASWVPAWTAIEFAASHPERVSHLVLCGTSTRGTDLYTESFTATVEIGKIDRDQLFRVAFHSALGWSQGDAADRLAEALVPASAQKTPGGTAARGILGELKAVNLDDVAGRLDVPTLVLHPRGSQLVSEGTAVRLTAAIPNAELVLLDGSSIDLRFGVADQALAAINAFLEETSEPGEPAAGSSRAAAGVAPGPPYPDGLSPREVEVLRLVAMGATNAEIAERLVISINTVTRHVSNIFDKTGATNRVEATRYAIRHALTE